MIVDPAHDQVDALLYLRGNVLRISLSAFWRLRIDLRL